jgi:NAD(P)-dependent dehydrogenase (short-subunit alcohol dehydrogenase family)
LGSIGKAATYSVFPVPAYKIAKAALNMLTVQYSLAFAKEGFTFVAVSPGVSYSFVPFQTIADLLSTVGAD